MPKRYSFCNSVYHPDTTFVNNIHLSDRRSISVGDSVKCGAICRCLAWQWSECKNSVLLLVSDVQITEIGHLSFLTRCMDFNQNSSLYITDGYGVCNSISSNAPNISQTTLSDIQSNTMGKPIFWYKDSESVTGKGIEYANEIVYLIYSYFMSFDNGLYPFCRF